VEEVVAEVKAKNVETRLLPGTAPEQQHLFFKLKYISN